MKNLSLFIILLCITSSCNFLRKVRSEKIPTIGNPQSYDGTYLNQIDKKHALWPLLTNNKSRDSSGTVTFRTLDKNTVMVSHQGTTSGSFLIKGLLKKEKFRFNKRRTIRGAFPLIWIFRCNLFTIGKDKEGNIVLSDHDSGCVGLIIPLGAAGEFREYILHKK